ncbi:tripartite tricarboxylate transporter substrate binding protein [Bordetella bronchialis]|uniref:Tat pathway signal protein n=1 Tax=Bordetella bronchialis TaxID=463025 RepID=A0A193FL90_9BORD|nr:tripartite tricarboxylate transporter substrate binding protein [Bordetella bronchialis]ANN68430.1 Tat pathway signal protein [Bordetella bronchialis]ANN73571.1 Tat pathway signal protein [Bordetella bronchialis]
MTRLIPRLRATLAIAAALLALPQAARAANDYPAMPVRLIVPYTAGGGVDLIARLMAERLHDTLGQSIIVENKPGASGMIGANYVAKAKPDGYTILLSAAGEIVVNPSLYKEKMMFDPSRELASVTLVARIPNVLVVNPSVPARTPAELLAYARSQPGKLTFSSSGVGNLQHVSGALLDRMGGIDVRHIPYKGAAQQIADVVAQHVTMTFTSVAAAMPFIKSGQVRPIAVTSTHRLEALPQVPALSETPALGGYEVVNWFGLFAPGATPAAILDKLNQAAVAAMKDPRLLQALKDQGAEPAPGSRQDFDAFRRAETAKFAKVIADTGITLQE